MKDNFRRYGSWALVAGAASGIGAAFSEALARKGMSLVMADRNTEQMAELASQLETKYQVKVVQLCQDLSQRDAWRNCMDSILPYDCRFLVYVPAFSPIGSFLENSEADLDLFLDLNCRTPLKLVQAFAEKIKDHGPGGIVLMSSLAGLVGPPLSAVYAGTKAFSILLGESLHSEFREHSIDVTVCCAGMTDTPTFWSSEPLKAKNGAGIMRSSRVAEFALKNIGKKTVCIAGWKNRLSYFFLLRLLPRGVAARIVSRAMIRIYPDRSS